jgi:hypothetical protein
MWLVIVKLLYIIWHNGMWKIKTNYQSTLRNIPKERRSRLPREQVWNQFFMANNEVRFTPECVGAWPSHAVHTCVRMTGFEACRLEPTVIFWFKYMRCIWRADWPTELQWVQTMHKQYDYSDYVHSVLYVYFLCAKWCFCNKYTHVPCQSC